MELVNKQFGASGKIVIAFKPEGIVIDVSDDEKLSEQSIHVVVKADALVDAIIEKVGAPAWLVGIGDFIKKELEAVSK